MLPVNLRAMLPSDWPEVRRIYVEGLATRQATFQTEAPSWEAWDAGHRPTCRILCGEGEEILGWAALNPVSSRPVYAGVQEVSVYVAAVARGRGVGQALLTALVAASEREGIWTLQSGISPENAASLALHARHGFREVGRRERIATLDGIWRDTLLLERRSAKV